MTVGWDTLKDQWSVAVLFVGLVLVALLVNRFRPQGRKMLRRTVILFVLLVAVLGLRLVARETHAALWESRAIFASELLEAFVGVNLVAALIYELALPAVSIDLPTIVTDITIGIAYIAVTMGALHSAGFNASSVLGASAVASAILALSLQSTLGNIIGGVALQLDGSFQEGDWLQLENGRQGKVKEIRWRHTVLETRDWGTLIVPNSALLQSQILVLGKREGQPRGRHRYWVYFNVDFRYSPTRVIEVVNEALQNAPIPNVAEEPKPHAICFDFASAGRDSYGYYAVRYWLTDLALDDPTNSAVRTRIFAALRRAAIPLALPAQTVFHAPGGDEEEARRKVRHRKARMEALHSVSLFKPLTEKEMESLVDNLRYAPFTRGETVTRQGNVAHWLYILISGSVEIRIRGEGISKDVATIDAPSFFGEMGLMTGEPRAADVVALTDVECYRLDKAAFNHVMQERPAIADEFSHTLATRRAELLGVREGLSEEERKRRQKAEEERILSRIKEFFALE